MAGRKQRQVPAAWRNRIKEYRTLDVRELQDNAGNWRRHPASQAAAMEGILREVGIAGALTAYYSVRYNGALTLIDGHLRKDQGGAWPVLILDVTDEEADLLLATLDPLAAMAEADASSLGRLLHTVSTGEVGLMQMLESLAVEAQVIPPDEDQSRGGRHPSRNTHNTDDAFGNLASGPTQSNVFMVQLFLTDDTYPAFKRAVDALGVEYGTGTITETVAACVRLASDALVADAS